MSLDLGIRKNGVELCFFTSSEKITQAIDPRYVEDWTPITTDSFERAIEDLCDEKRRWERDIDKEKEALKYINSTEDIYCALNSIKDYEKEIADIDVAVDYLYLLIRIANECDYTEEGSRIESVMEYVYG